MPSPNNSGAVFAGGIPQSSASLQAVTVDSTFNRVGATFYQTPFGTNNVATNPSGTVFQMLFIPAGVTIGEAASFTPSASAVIRRFKMQVLTQCDVNNRTFIIGASDTKTNSTLTGALAGWSGFIITDSFTTNFTAVNNSAGTTTTGDIIAYDQTFHEFSISIKSTTVGYSADGVVKATLTTNITGNAVFGTMTCTTNSGTGIVSGGSGAFILCAMKAT